MPEEYLNLFYSRCSRITLLPHVKSFIVFIFWYLHYIFMPLGNLVPWANVRDCCPTALYLIHYNPRIYIQECCKQMNLCCIIHIMESYYAKTRGISEPRYIIRWKLLSLEVRKIFQVQDQFSFLQWHVSLNRSPYYCYKAILDLDVTCSELVTVWSFESLLPITKEVELLLSVSKYL